MKKKDRGISKRYFYDSTNKNDRLQKYDENDFLSGFDGLVGFLR